MRKGSGLKGEGVEGMSDYKWEMQMRAEELAEANGADYMSLDANAQCRYFERGMAAWREAQFDKADALRKREREG